MYGKLHILFALLYIAIITSADDKSKSDNSGNKGGSTNGNSDGGNKGGASTDSSRVSAFSPYKVHPQLVVPPSQPFNSLMPAGSTNGLACNRLIDTQYPIFSEMCGAVPQARYGLPNTFGHKDRWEISHLLTILMGSTTDPTCIRSLRMLLCPMFFQPCRAPHEPPLVLPCQYYCQAVKAQCGVPALDIIPCELLPYASDYCPNLPIPSPSTPAPVNMPTNQSPQNDTAIPPSIPSASMQRSYEGGASKPAAPTLSSNNNNQTPNQAQANQGSQAYQLPVKYVPSFYYMRQPPVANVIPGPAGGIQITPYGQNIKP